jgi:hypothetical protein
MDGLDELDAAFVTAAFKRSEHYKDGDNFEVSFANGLWWVEQADATYSVVANEALGTFQFKKLEKGQLVITCGTISGVNF